MNADIPPDSSDSSQKPPGWGMFVIGWLLALAILTLIFNGFLENRQNPNRLSVLQNQSSDELLLQANVNGHYYAEGHINGTETLFLLDTGATTVAVPQHIADRAGLQAKNAVSIDTAAGVILAHSTHIRRLQIGHFIFSDLDAVILPGDDDNTVLLGMNALGELELRQQDGELLLQKP